MTEVLSADHRRSIRTSATRSVDSLAANHPRWRRWRLLDGDGTIRADTACTIDTGGACGC